MDMICVSATSLVGARIIDGTMEEGPGSAAGIGGFSSGRLDGLFELFSISDQLELEWLDLKEFAVRRYRFDPIGSVLISGAAVSDLTLFST